jgi:PPOX class probable F420-dependent enzyme
MTRSCWQEDVMAENGKLTPEQVAILRKKQFAHLATVMPDGSPHVTAVWIDTDGRHVLINTAKGRIKHRNIARDPRVAVSIADVDEPYTAVTIRGRAELVDAGAEEHIDSLARKYLGQERYPFRQPDEQRVIVRITPVHASGAEAGTPAQDESGELVERESPLSEDTTEQRMFAEGRRRRAPMVADEDGEQLLGRVADAEPAPARGRDDLGTAGRPTRSRRASRDANQADNTSEWSRS